VLRKAHVQRTKNATACEFPERNREQILSGKDPSLGISIAHLNCVRLRRCGGFGETGSAGYASAGRARLEAIPW